MKCVALKGPRLFEVKEVEEPVSQNGSVVLDVKKTGICGSDLHNFENGEPLGVVMGHEFSGVVTDPGDRTDLKIGVRVTALPISPCGHCEACNSGNPQYCMDTWTYASGLAVTNPGGLAPKLSVRSDMVLKLPDNVSFEEGAMVEPAAVGLHAVNLAHIKEGQKVLVIGGGIIGLVSAMFAKMQGADYVAVSETNDSRGENAVKLGVADEWFDAKDPKVIEQMMIKTQGGFDVVIECCGNAPAVTSGIIASKNGGTVILVGVATAPITIPTVVAVLHELTLQGAIAYTKEEFAEVIDLISNKKIDVMKFVSEIVGLDDVQASYDKLMSGTADVIKILVDPNK